MSGYQGRTTNRPRDAIGAEARAETEANWGEMSGELVSPNGDGTWTVRPLFKRRLNGEPTQLPDLQSVLLHEGPRTGRGALTMGAKAGDIVTLRPKMVNSETYHVDGGAYEAPDARRNSLSDMEAYLEGGESVSNPLPNRDPDNVHLRFDDQGNFGVKGSPDGKVRIDGAQGNIYDLLAQVVELLATDGLNVLSGSSAGNGIHELEHRAQYDAIASKLRAMAL